MLVAGVRHKRWCAPGADQGARPCYPADDREDATAGSATARAPPAAAKRPQAHLPPHLADCFDRPNPSCRHRPAVPHTPIEGCRPARSCHPWRRTFAPPAHGSPAIRSTRDQRPRHLWRPTMLNRSTLVPAILLAVTLAAVPASAQTQRARSSRRSVVTPTIAAGPPRAAHSSAPTTRRFRLARSRCPTRAATAR